MPSFDIRRKIRFETKLHCLFKIKTKTKINLSILNPTNWFVEMVVDALHLLLSFDVGTIILLHPNISSVRK